MLAALCCLLAALCCLLAAGEQHALLPEAEPHFDHGGEGSVRNSSWTSARRAEALREEYAQYMSAARLLRQQMEDAEREAAPNLASAEASDLAPRLRAPPRRVSGWVVAWASIRGLGLRLY